ncbi:MAG: esterase/lipase family protein, partial [Acidimicrobiales bacterium]
MAIVAAGTAIPSSAATVNQTKKYPVPWDFLLDAVLAAAQNGPTVPPPGATNPSDPCPNGTLAAHHNPVILIHGLLANENDNWQSISPFLADNGYCVYALTYGTLSSEPPLDLMGGLTDMTASAQQLSAFVVQVLRNNPGVTKVDIVGHSEGGTMPDWYLKFDGGALHVAHFVALSGVLHGTNLLGAGELYALGQPFGLSHALTQSVASFCESCIEFLPSSTWMKTLDDPHASG